jgi:hypothetical protein
MSWFIGTEADNRREQAQEARNAAHNDLAAVAKRRGDLLWYILDDVVHGRVSELAQVDTILRALKNEGPPGPLVATINVEMIKRQFSTLPRSSQQALLDVLHAEYEKGS